MFQNREWPVGFEFPSCFSCNNGTRKDDLLVAMLARMDPITEKGDLDGKLSGLMYEVNRQFPNIYEKMMPRAIEARRRKRQLGIRPHSGLTHQEAGGIKVTEEMHNAVCTLARKLAKGVFYKETSKCFPNDGCLLLNWFTNVELYQHGTYKTFDALRDLPGKAPPLERTGHYLNDQFEYKLSISVDHGYMLLQAKFGNAFAFVVICSANVGVLEKMIERLRGESKRLGPFAVLQSPILSS
jgi:hypothetical protein